MTREHPRETSSTPLPATTGSSFVVELLCLVWALYLTGPIYDQPIFRAIADGNYFRFFSFLESDLGVADASYRVVQSRWLFDLISSYASDWGENALVGLKFASTYLTVRLLFLLLRRLSNEQSFSLLLTLFVTAGIFARGTFDAENLVFSLLLVGLNIGFRIVECSQIVARLLSVFFFVVAANISPVALVFLALAMVQISILRSHIATSMLISLVASFVIRPDFPNGSGWLFGELIWYPLRAFKGFVPELEGFDQAIMVLLAATTFLITDGTMLRRVLRAFSIVVVPLLVAQAFLPYRHWCLILLAISACFLWGRERGGERLRVAFEKLAHLMSRLPRLGVIWLLGCFGIVFFVGLSRQPIYLGLLPTKAVDALLNEMKDGTVLHPARISSFLRFRLANVDGSPRLLIGSSERSPILDPERYNLLEGVEHDPSQFERAARVLQPGALLLPADSPVAAHVRQLPQWVELYRETGGESLPEYHKRSVERWVTFIHR